MSRAEKAVEPTMDDILASIRKIISEDGATSAPPGAPSAPTPAKSDAVSAAAPARPASPAPVKPHMNGAGPVARPPTAEAQALPAMSIDDILDLAGPRPLPAKSAPAEAPKPEAASAPLPPPNLPPMTKSAPRENGRAPSWPLQRELPEPPQVREEQPAARGNTELRSNFELDSLQTEPSLRAPKPREATSELPGFSASRGLDGLGAVVPRRGGDIAVAGDRVQPSRTATAVEPILPPAPGATPGAAAPSRANGPRIVDSRFPEPLSSQPKPAAGANPGAAIASSPHGEARSVVLPQPVLPGLELDRGSHTADSAPLANKSAPIARSGPVEAAARPTLETAAKGVAPATLAEPATPIADAASAERERMAAGDAMTEISIPIPSATKPPVEKSTDRQGPRPLAGMDSEPLQPPKPLVRAEPARGLASGDMRAAPPEKAQVRTLEDTVVELLRPMIRQWLDDNMPRMVEKALRVELADSVKPAADRSKH